MADRQGFQQHMRQSRDWRPMLDLDQILARADETPRQTTDVEVIFDVGISQELEQLRQERQVVTARLETIESELATELEQIGRDQRASDSRPAMVRKRAAKAESQVNAELEQIETRIVAAEERAAEYLVTFRFTALHGFEWDDLTGQSMPREGHPEDVGKGYNYDEVTRTAAMRSGVRVGPDDTTVEVTKAQWDGIWKTLPSMGRKAIKWNVWVLNEYTTIAARDEAVVAARKVSAARQAATQPSPSDSVSTRGA